MKWNENEIAKPLINIDELFDLAQRSHKEPECHIYTVSLNQLRQMEVETGLKGKEAIDKFWINRITKLFNVQ